MNIALMIAFMAAFAFLNRGRGSQFWNQIDSTVASRLVTTLSMSSLTMIASGSDEYQGDLILFWVWAVMSLWAFPGWDNYWSAAIGNAFNPNASTFAPVDWLMKRMPWFSAVYAATASNLSRRLWGTVAMGLRQALAAPCFIGLAYLTGHPETGWYAAGTLLLGTPYLLGGYVCKAYPVGFAEYCVGAVLGAMTYLTLL